MVYRDNQPMKASCYNIMYEGAETDIHYNTASGAIIKFKDEKRSEVKNMLESSRLYKNTNMELWNTLIENRFIVEKELDEMNAIKARIIRVKNRADSLIFSILPTTKCNFKCIYCFEQGPGSTMSEKDCKETIEFIKNQVISSKPAIVTIVWFGGEPLLEYNKIISMSAEIRDTCEKYKAVYQGSIITNGYLLSEEKAEGLKACNITGIQLTLDGTENIHNARRKHKSGQGSFTEVKKAILVAKDRFDNVMVRLNADKNNSDELFKLLDEPWLYDNKINVAVGQLENFNDSCKGINEINVLKREEYYPIACALRVKYNEKSGRDANNLASLMQSLPVKSKYCGATDIGQWVMGPEQKIFKCLASTNNGDECGYIEKGKLYPKNKLYEWLFDDPTMDAECMVCKLFPICMGGCIKMRKMFKNRSQSGLCAYWERYLNDILCEITK